MEFSLSDWFDAFVSNAATSKERQLDLVEVLADSANELYVNAVAAMHLRRWGRDWADKTRPGAFFWVRTEWEKVDLSYGLAPERFDDWNKAWPMKTGDLGQIESKLVYDHFSESENAGRVAELRRQIDERRARDESREKSLRLPGHASRQRYHGLIWFFEGANGSHQATDLPTMERSLDRQFGRAPRFRTIVEVERELDGLWPLTSHASSYRPRLHVAFVEGPQHRS